MNIIVAAVLLLGWLLQYLQVTDTQGWFVLALGMPVLILLNVLFVGYWLLRWKRVWWISVVALLPGGAALTDIYAVGGTPSVVSTSAVKVMSYNVRVFNVYKWIERDGVQNEIMEVISDENPDILCIQEFFIHQEKAFDYYPYKAIDYKTKETGQAIFSRYPILQSGNLEFRRSGNGAIWADLLIREDTVRVYNMHLQSFQINPETQTLDEENTRRIFGRVSYVFRQQQEQTAMFLEHRNRYQGKVIICTDLNNNQFSSVYRQVKGEGIDSFSEEGSGTGRTYYFAWYPLRIDFIFADPSMRVLSHKVIPKMLSDHYPIVSQLEL